MAKTRQNPIIFKLKRRLNRRKGRKKIKSGKYDIKKKTEKQISQTDATDKKQAKNENQMYWIRAITGVLTALIGTAAFGLIGWAMFGFFILFLLVFPFIISFFILKIPYKKKEWDWKKILSKGLSPQFFLFLLISTVIHTHIVNDDFNVLWDNPADTHGLIVSDDGKTMYVADGSNGLVVLDITNPGHRDFLGKYNEEGSYNSVTRINDTVYVINENTGLMAFDISNANLPNLLNSSFPNLKDAKNIESNGNYLFISDGEEGLTIINATNKNNLNTITTINTDGSVENVFIDNNSNLTYIADGNMGLKLLNISNMVNPTLLNSTFKFSSSTKDVLDVVVNNSTAYLAHAEDCLVIVNVTDSINMTLKGYYNFTDCAPQVYLESLDEDIDSEDLAERKAQNILLYDNRVFIASGSLGIVSYDITNDSIALYYDTKGIAQDMCIVGDQMFIAEGSQAISILNASLSWTENLILSPEPLQSGQKKIPFGSNYMIFSLITIINLVVIVNKKRKKSQ